LYPAPTIKKDVLDMVGKLYDRKTRICQLSDLRPDHQQAIAEHCTLYNLGDLGGQARLCGETISEKKQQGLMSRLTGGGDRLIYASVIITPPWLIWVVSTEKQKPVVLSAKLNEIEVTHYDPRLIPDYGLNILARPTDTTEHGSHFIGLSEDDAGKRLHDEIMQAARGG
jgi:hypothetical protein